MFFPLFLGKRSFAFIPAVMIIRFFQFCFVFVTQLTILHKLNLCKGGTTQILPVGPVTFATFPRRKSGALGIPRLAAYSH